MLHTLDAVLIVSADEIAFLGNLEEIVGKEAGRASNLVLFPTRDYLVLKYIFNLFTV